jgi:hypothetical protein
MANPEHLAILKDVDTWNEWRKLNPEIAPDLSDADLHEAHLAHANLSETKLEGANLVRATLTEADLTSADLANAWLSHATLTRACLFQAGLNASHCRGAYFGQADLREAPLRWADLREANFSRAKLCWTYLEMANLQGAYLAGADLSHAVLYEARLTDAILDGAILTGAGLWETMRSGWSIKGVICERASWDSVGVKVIEYAPGEFERLYTGAPTIELHYKKGISRFELNTLPLLMHRLAADHPGCVFHLRSVEESAGGVNVVIVVEEGNAEELHKDALRLQELQIRARLSEERELRMERLVEKMATEFFGAVPKIVEAAKVNRVSLSGGTINIGKIGGGSHDVIALNDLTTVEKVMSEILSRRTELNLPSTALAQLERSIQEIQTELTAKRPARTAIHAPLKTVRNILEGAAGSAIATAVWPTITNSWLPAVTKFLATLYPA